MLLMQLFGWFNAVCSKILDHHMVELRGFPYSFRVLLKPQALIKVLRKNGMGDTTDNIRLGLGKIDGIIGRYDLRNGKTDIDVGEIAVKKLRNPTPEELDREVTSVLAHELRHRWQHETYGKFRLLWDKLLIFFGILGFAAYFVIPPWVRLLLKGFGSGNPLLILAAGAGVLLLLFVARSYFVLAVVFSYKYCWCERDARRYAEEVLNNPKQWNDWKEVIEVEVSQPMASQQHAVEQLMSLVFGGQREIVERIVERLSEEDRMRLRRGSENLHCTN